MDTNLPRVSDTLLPMEWWLQLDVARHDTACFDRLPREVREAIANANVGVSASWAEQCLAGGVPEWQVIAAIRGAH